MPMIQAMTNRSDVEEGDGSGALVAVLLLHAITTRMGYIASLQ